MATLRSVPVRKSKKSAPRPAAVARTVMTADPETVGEEATLLEAASLMAQIGVRHLPVIDDSGVLTGMLSDRDLRSALGDLSEALRDNSKWGESRVVDVMTPDPLRAELDTTVAEVATMLADERIGAVPVVDEADHPVGIVSYVDLIHFLAKGI